ncbi:MAG TPA: dihydrodipicolinate synthase family protein [Longimicrobiales bacterium]|nr:dihydrodipicolinate synthase family protein [Longimicrobiales bacterium]
MPEDRSWLQGLFVPVTTPFDPVTGDIAPVSFRDNLRRWLQTPIDGFVAFGSTGEGALLDEDEMVQLLEYARDVVPPQRPLVAGAGGESTRAVIRMARRFAGIGADAVLVHPPAYFGVSLSPADHRDHFLAVAEASSVPVIVYHMPKFTHVTLDAGLMAELSRHENIAGIKDSSGDLKRFAEYTASCDGSCRLFVGNGALLYAALELGAAGGILALGLLAPEDYGELLRLYRGGELPAAGAIQERLAPAHQQIVAAFGARGVKAALEMKGWNGGPPRSPLSPLKDKDRETVARVMQEARLL